MQAVDQHDLFEVCVSSQHPPHSRVPQFPKELCASLVWNHKEMCKALCSAVVGVQIQGEVSTS